MIRLRLLALGMACAAVCAAPPLFAQTPPPASPPFTAGWRDGFSVQTPDGDFRLQFGLVAQADGRFVLDESAAGVIDTFSIRKARPAILGRIARYFDFQVVPDFGNGNAVLQDAFFDIRFSPAFRVRTGKAKSPIGYEILIGDPFLLFPERSLASSLVPNRDVGVHALGELGEGRFAYQAAVLNGQLDGASSVTDLDTNDGKDVAARIVVQPFRRAENPTRLNGFGFALGSSTGTRDGALPSFRTPIGQRYFTYAADVAATGRQTRVTPAAFFYLGPFGAFAEYVRSSSQLVSPAATRDVTHTAWDIAGSFVLTGETGADRGVRPRVSFDPPAGEWGALQLVARYSELTVDQDVFDAGLATSVSSREAHQLTIGANWYPVHFIKYYLTFERITFEGPLQPRAAEKSVVFRAQVAF